MADVLATLARRVGDLLAPAGNLLLHGFGPGAGQIIIVDGHFDFQPRGHVIAQDMNDAADGVAFAAGLLDHFHHHDLAGAGAAQRFGGNQEIVGDVLAVRHHEVDAALLVQAAHDAVGLAFQHLHHAAFPAAAAVDAPDADQGAVVVHQRAHLLG